MTKFDKEYYNTLTEKQKIHYLEDYNLRLTINRVYNLTGVPSPENIGRGQTKPLLSLMI